MTCLSSRATNTYLLARHMTPMLVLCALFTPNAPAQSSEPYTRLEAEDYDSYHDTSPGNAGGAYRGDDVDIEALADGEGYNVGWADPGEWLSYSVILDAGQYRFSARVATPYESAAYSLSLDDNTFHQASLTGTGGWQSWVLDETDGELEVSESGVHTLRFSFQGALNLDYIDIARINAPTDPTEPTEPTDPTGSALPCSASASSSEAGFTPAAVCDENPATRWGSAFNDQEWLQLDLGAVYDIERVELDWEAAFGRAYELQVSRDALNWQIAVSQNAGSGGSEVHAFTPTPARYVRLMGLARGTEWGYSLWDVRVFGDTGTQPEKTLLSETFGGKSMKLRKRLTQGLAITCISTLCAAFTEAQTTFSEDDFQKVTVAARGSLNLPQEFEIAGDGRVFVASKCGDVYGWQLDEDTPAVIGTLPNVRCAFEDGLLSLALDPDFPEQPYLYFQYTAPGSLTRVSRYSLDANGQLDTTSESILLEWQTGNEATGHMGGSMLFDLDGNLIITTGDNLPASGYFAPGAQATSGNTNDLRGKVLRIRPTAEGGYTVPAGNLFADDGLHRPEIYAMGFRNPYRLNMDPATGFFYVGDIGPDSSADSAEGPAGIDEINEIRSAGNFGWPFVIGDNRPYPGFDPNRLVNEYSGNTGARELPAAQGSIWDVRHQATMAGPVYRYDDTIDSEFKLPEAFDGHLIFWDFNSSRFFTLDVDSAEQPRPHAEFPIYTQGFQGAIDVELDPRTQQLYVLEWGSGCCDKEPFNNAGLYRFDYIGDRDNGTNIALGASITASSEIGGNAAAFAVDGDASTRWESAFEDPQTLELDLADTRVLSAIVIQWEGAFSESFVLEASTDAQAWTTLFSENNNTGGTQLHLINDANAYRYLRLRMLTRGTGYGHSIFEFEVYAEEGSAPLGEHAYLNMPRTLDARFTGVPQRLSETGAFTDTANLTPAPHLIPFAPNSKLWSDRALKQRWLSLPADSIIEYAEREHWNSPEGSVAIKHFELPLATGETRRLETRLLVMQGNGRVYGLTYRWQDDQRDAELLTTEVFEDFEIQDADGSTWTQTWAYPSPTQCLDCHNSASSQFLAINTRQLNGDFPYASGTENQLLYWSRHALIDAPITAGELPSLPRTAAIDDNSAALELRIKSYLDTNCAHCHGTGNGGSQWDARFHTPLAAMQVLDSPTTGIRNYLNDYGIEDARVVASGNPAESILYIRDKSTDPNDRMPPLARALEHEAYIDALEQWINGLDGSETAPPVSVGAAGQSSTGEPANIVAQALDGDPSTLWSSEFAQGQWLEVDLGQAYDIERIVLDWEAIYQSGYVIEGSNDRQNWTVLVEVNGPTECLQSHVGLEGRFRYLRLTRANSQPDWGFALWEFEVYGTQDDPGETPDTPAPHVLPIVATDASSALAPHLATSATDGDAATRWESAHSDPQYLQLDFGATQHLTELTLHWEAAYASQYSLLSSNDGQQWSNIKTVENSLGGEQVLALNGETGRYLRILGTARATGYGYSLWEVSAKGLAADPNLRAIDIVSPAEGERYGNRDNITLNLSFSHNDWLSSGGRIRYQLDDRVPVTQSSATANLGQLNTGSHTLRATLVDSNGNEVGVPRTRQFSVSCDEDCPTVLVFSKTSGFRHGSIPAGIAMLERIGAEHGYTLFATEDAAHFDAATLANYSTVVFMNTTGDIFTEAQRAAFRSFIESGGGYVGMHSAADTEHNWPWYTDTLLAGAEFLHHGDGIPNAHIDIEWADTQLDHIDGDWWMQDEWYFWVGNPRNNPTVEVLATLDRSSYPSNYPVEDHPIIFRNSVEQGRVFYTAIGHVDANFSDPDVEQMIQKAILWTSE